MVKLKSLFGLPIVLIFSSSLLVGFQNCGRAFQAINDGNVTSNNDTLKNTSSLALASSGGAMNTFVESCNPNMGWICMEDSLIPRDTTIGAWYTVYWYGKSSQLDHWSEWSRYEPTLGYYDSGDIIKKQESYFERAGINYLILDHTNGWGNDGGRIIANIRKVFAQLSHKYPIALALGAPLWLAQPNENKMPPGEAKAARARAMQIEADSTWAELANQPNYLKWHDPATNSYKPLLVIYNDIQGSYPNDQINRYWKDPRFTVRYSAGTSDSKNPLLQPYAMDLGGIWGWAVKYPQIISNETMAVQAGHNTSHLASHAGTSVPVYKNNGQAYMQQWLHIIKNKPRNIIIPSWNDWGEETAIEPGRRRVPTAELLTDSYGEEVDDWLLQITAAYTNLRKGLMPDTYYRTEDDPQVYKVENGKLVAQSEMPHRKPVVLLPAGTLKPYISRRDDPGTPGPTPINGGWSGWYNEGTCSKSCGGGWQNQVRSCTNPTPANGGAICSGVSTQQVACNTHSCAPTPQIPINGGWSGWYNEGTCSKSCGGGWQNQVRSCTNPAPANGGAICSGASTQQVACNTHSCEPASQTPISEGLFMVPPHIYYSNGLAYCYFPSMEFFTQRTGRTNVNGIRQFSSIPTTMRNDGNCQAP
jgi:hypothetical protein